MALVDGGYLHSAGMKKFLKINEEILKKSSSLKPLFLFEIISHECSLGDPIKKAFDKF